MILQKNSQEPIIGEIVPIYNKYLNLKPNSTWTDENAGVVYYVLGDKTTLKEGDSKLLSQLYHSHFGENEMIMPEVKNKGIIGGFPIFDVKGQTGFDRIFRDTIGVSNNETTGESEVLPSENKGVENMEDDNKILTEIPPHVHDLTEDVGEGFGLSQYDMSADWRNPKHILDEIGVEKIEAKDLVTTKSPVNTEQVDVSDIGTEDLVFCVIIDLIHQSV